jgi:hypothetical protein
LLYPAPQAHRWHTQAARAVAEVGIDGYMEILHVSFTIGGKPAQILYAGAAPGGVAGFMQLNVVIPPGLPPARPAPGRDHRPRHEPGGHPVRDEPGFGRQVAGLGSAAASSTRVGDLHLIPSDYVESASWPRSLPEWSKTRLQ